MNMIDTEEIQTDFAREVESMSQTCLNMCWHCACCSGGCPFSKDMDILPNAVLRMVQYGLKAQVLGCSTIWICVGCNTCSMECPNAVDMAAVMDALRQIAIRDRAAIAEPGILRFHQTVVESIRRYGRTHKLDIMMRYKISERDFLSDIDLGLKMLSRRKLDLLPSRVRNQKAITDLFTLAGELS